MKHYSSRENPQSAVCPLLKPLSISILAALSMSSQVWAVDNLSLQINENNGQQQLTESCDATALSMDSTSLSVTNCSAVSTLFLNPAASSCKLNSLQINNAGEITLSVNNCLNEPEIDTDNDTVLDNEDNCPTVANTNQANLDSDNLGDACDSDKDGDGIDNNIDLFPSDPTEAADSDLDGIGNNADNCPAIANSTQANLDGDDFGDVCDSDRDGDGAPNTTDVFPSNPAEWLDSDHDRIGDNADNCPLVPNKAQINSDTDTLGNACDDDDDNDGMTDQWEYLHGLNPLSADTRDEGDFDGDGYSDREEFEAGTDPRDPNSHVQAIVSINVDDNVNSGWKSIDIGTSHSPVVLAGPPSFNDDKPGVVRIRTTDDGFDIRFQPWEYLSDPNHPRQNPGHGTESVPLLVLEEGRHIMSDGSIWEVGTFTLTDSGSNNYQSVPFGKEFVDAEGQSQIPHLFLTIQSTEDTDAVTVRAKNVTANDFEAALYEEENEMPNGQGLHGEETVGYVAIYSKNGSGEINVDDQRVPYAIQRLGVNSGNTPVFNSILTVQEEQSFDDETFHGMDENYDVLAIGSALFAQDVSSAGGNTTSPRLTAAPFPENIEWGTVAGITDNWVDVPLSHNYLKPVVVAELDENDIATGDTPHLRLRRGLNGSFQVHVNEGKEEGQRVHYMVAESGTHELGGLKFEAGLIATSSDHIKTINFSTDDNDNNYFTEAPAVFSSVMTTFGDGDVEAIVDNDSDTKFNIGMDVPGHRLEVLGWIAIENGSTDNSGNYNGRKADINNNYTPSDNDSIVLRGNNDSALVAE